MLTLPFHKARFLRSHQLAGPPPGAVATPTPPCLRTCSAVRTLPTRVRATWPSPLDPASASASALTYFIYIYMSYDTCKRSFVFSIQAAPVTRTRARKCGAFAAVAGCGRSAWTMLSASALGRRSPPRPRREDGVRRGHAAAPRRSVTRGGA